MATRKNNSWVPYSYQVVLYTIGTSAHSPKSALFMRPARHFPKIIHLFSMFLLAGTNCALLTAQTAARAEAEAGEQQDPNALTATEPAVSPRFHIPPISSPLLRGSVSESRSPLLENVSPQEVKQGTPLHITFSALMNSEISKVGDEVYGTVSADVETDGHVILPGQWRVHGTVTEVKSRQRLGRDGWISVKFDKLISPDGKFSVPIEAEVTTKDSALKTTVRQIGTGTRYTGQGALGGSLTALQLGGLPLAISTYGLSIATGATAGAMLGGIAWCLRKGKIRAVSSGEDLQVSFKNPVVLPAFDPDTLPSAEAPPKLENFEVKVIDCKFTKDPFGDPQSRLLRISIAIDNQTAKAYRLGDFAVISDHNKLYFPHPLATDRKNSLTKIEPNATEEASLVFGVDSPKRKYFLTLVDKSKGKELTRIPLN